MTNFKTISTRDLFNISNAPSLNKKSLNQRGSVEYPYVTRTRENNGVDSYTGFIDNEHLNPTNTFSLGLMQMSVNFQEHAWYSGQFVKIITPKIEVNHEVGIYLQTWISKLALTFDPQAIRNVDTLFYKAKFVLPFNENNSLDTDYITNYIDKIEAQYIAKINDNFQYLKGC